MNSLLTPCRTRLGRRVLALALVGLPLLLSEPAWADSSPGGTTSTATSPASAA